jgi:hypothetical protein
MSTGGLTLLGDVLGKGWASRHETLARIALGYRISALDTLLKTGDIFRWARPHSTRLIGVVPLWSLLEASRTQSEHATEGHEEQICNDSHLNSLQKYGIFPCIKIPLAANKIVVIIVFY